MLLVFNTARYSASPNTIQNTFIFGKKDNSYKNTVSPKCSDLLYGQTYSHMEVQIHMAIQIHIYKDNGKYPK